MIPVPAGPFSIIQSLLAIHQGVPPPFVMHRVFPMKITDLSHSSISPINFTDHLTDFSRKIKFFHEIR